MFPLLEGMMCSVLMPKTKHLAEVHHAEFFLYNALLHSSFCKHICGKCNAFVIFGASEENRCDLITYVHRHFTKQVMHAWLWPSFSNLTWQAVQNLACFHWPLAAGLMPDYNSSGLTRDQQAHHCSVLQSSSPKMYSCYSEMPSFFKHI